MDRLVDKVALISGANSGIGLAAARLFVAEGASVVGIGFDPDRTRQAAEEVGFTPVVGSVDDADLWDRAMEVAAELGGPDIAHLNAGRYGYLGPIGDLPLDDYRQTLGANVDGVVLGTRAAVPAMAARGGGAIVVTASTAGLVPSSLNPIYTLTKHAVIGFVRAEAQNVAADGITINAVCPSFVDTPLTTAALGGADPATLGVGLLDAGTVAAVALDLATSEGTGRCVAMRAGSPPEEWSFPS
jgi:NAD(P)-dependent dehydrogenase (short-subunit alcohol dehydrogenase family)